MAISCGKKGCTDPVAHNFDPSATKDDGTCFFGLDDTSAFFTFAPTSNPNVVVFTAKNPNVECSWDFGNGTTGSGTVDTAEYPFAGNFTVTLSIFNSQGDASSSQSIEIISNDISLFDNPLHLLLTGGINGPGILILLVIIILALVLQKVLLQIGGMLHQMKNLVLDFMTIELLSIW